MKSAGRAIDGAKRVVGAVSLSFFGDCGVVDLAARPGYPAGGGHGNADQVVDRGGHLEPGSVALSASVAELVSAGDGPGTTEWFRKAFADPLTHLVPGVSSGSRVDR
jgi:hypothetical protein